VIVSNPSGTIDNFASTWGLSPGQTIFISSNDFRCTNNACRVSVCAPAHQPEQEVSWTGTVVDDAITLSPRWFHPRGLSLPVISSVLLWLDNGKVFAVTTPVEFIDVGDFYKVPQGPLPTACPCVG